VGVRVRVGLGVGVGVRVRVGLGVGVGVRVRVGLGVGVGVLVRVGLGVGVGVLVRVGVGVGVGGVVVTVGVGVGVGVVVVVVGVGVGVVVQSGTVMTSWSRVTAAVRASARPVILTPVVTVIEASAMMVPRKVELVPRVAELPTCQKTLQGEAPPVRRIELADAVIRVEGTWKIQTAAGSPCAFRVRLPLICSEVTALYTPGVRVVPVVTMGPIMAVGMRPAASTYAAVRSDWAWPATASPAWMAPFTTPGGKPVIAAPGKTPRSPLMIVWVATGVGALVTVVPARTPKLLAVPRFTVATAAPATDCVAMSTAMAVPRARQTARTE
jgi:hypothetical protein